MKASVEYITKRAGELSHFLTIWGVSEKWFIMVMQIDQIKEKELGDIRYLDDRIQNHLEVQGVEIEEIVHEEDLPVMSDVEYTEWIRTSKVVKGERVGKSYICIADKLINLFERKNEKDNQK
jgi:hypothetical protein